MKRRQHSRITAFVEAMANERQYDIYGMAMAGLPMQDEQAYLLRPLRLARLATRWPQLTRTLLLTAGHLWWMLLPALLVLGMFKLAVAKLRCPSKRCDLQRVALGSTSRVVASLGRVPADDRPRSLLTFPWVRLPEVPQDYQQMSLLNLMRWSDLWAAMWDASLGALAACRKFSRPMDRLQTYCALEWMVTWRVLARELEFSEEVWLANHLDRWAVLVDRLTIDAKRVCMQHGCLHAGHTMPTRLDRCSRMYYFDEPSRSRFMSDVLSDTTETKWCLVSAGLRLVDFGLPPGVPSVLMVGHPSQIDFERCLTEQLLASRPDLLVVIKPHPSFTNKGYVNFPEQRVRWANEPDVFPRVDVVACQRSTLGLEYEASGVSVVWLADHNVGEAWDLITRQLEQQEPRRQREVRPTVQTSAAPHVASPEV